ncbi:MAG TPA: hypothetical protein VMW31_03250, partial [Devosiaceae bacterium]|nr:hypothetical protein [Devosiaceae bacterium]
REAQQYFQAALEKKPDATSVINNLALSYALDGKAKESEALLRTAAKNGHDDKRLRQNLALVLGVQGKFDEARQVAAVDMTEQQAKSSMSYLRSRMVKPTEVASAGASAPRKAESSAEDWSPFASNEPVKAAASPVQIAANTSPPPLPAEVQVVYEVATPVAAGAKQAKSAKAATPAPVPAEVAQTQRPKLAKAVGSPPQIAPASLLRTDID